MKKKKKKNRNKTKTGKALNRAKFPTQAPTVLFNSIKPNLISNKIYLNPLDPYLDPKYVSEFCLYV